MSADGADSYLTPAQLARILGLSARTISRWARHGRIPCLVTVDGELRFRREEVEAIARRFRGRE